MAQPELLLGPNAISYGELFTGINYYEIGYAWANIIGRLSVDLYQ